MNRSNTEACRSSRVREPQAELEDTAQLFLGMSPQAFLKLDTPLLKQSLALRRAVLGAPAQALASDPRS